MPVSLDQRALLDLLLVRGHTYADVADLLGVDAHEARARAHGVVESVADTELPLAGRCIDYLLGQLGSEESEDFVGVLRRDAQLLDFAEELSAKLRLLMPRGTLPSLPEPVEPRPPAKAAVRPPPARADPEVPEVPRPSPEPVVQSPRARADPDRPVDRKPERTAASTKDQTRPQPRTTRGRSAQPKHDRPARTSPLGRLPLGSIPQRIAASALLLAVGAAIAFALAAPLGDEDVDEAASSPSPAPRGPQATIVALRRTRAAPYAASGRAAIAPTNQGAALEYQAASLQPTRGPQRYVVWLYNDRDAAVPVTAGKQVARDGRLSGVAALPAAVVGVLPQTRFIDISLEPSREKRGTTKYQGVSVLRGPIPKVPAGGTGAPPTP